MSTNTVETHPENTKPKTSEKSPLEGWALFDANDVYETTDMTVFEHFLNSKGTTLIELANLKVDKLSLVIRGIVGGEDMATVIFHKPLTNISRPKKIELVQAIQNHPGIANIAKNRLGATLAAYFNVTKETSND
jgi:hypothetical protein